jgi:hypothetical protein
MSTPADRRAHARYAPKEVVQVLFGHADAELPTYGHIADVSPGGVRIVAPPMARPFLHWPDVFSLQISFSESVRAAGVEGTVLRARVVRIQVDARAYLLQAEFDRTGADGDWDALARWTASLERGR